MTKNFRKQTDSRSSTPSVKILASIALSAFFIAVASAGESFPRNLTTERVPAPVGIDVPAPRLSWKLPDGTQSQKAYEIEADGVPCGFVESSSTIDIPWPGRPLETGSRHKWRVRFRNADGKVSPWSDTAAFVAGVMEEGGWKAKWIAANAVTRPDVDFLGARWGTMPGTGGVLRCTFTLDSIPKTKEIVFLSKSPYVLKLNGVESRGTYSGHSYDGRFAKFHDLADEASLKTGENVLEFSVKRRRRNCDGGGDLAVIGVMRENGRSTAPMKWIGAEDLGGLHDVPWATNLVLRDEIASPAFEKRFAVRAPVRRATLFITGVGFYEASLNGKRIGDKVLDPSPTDYAKRVLYSTYILDKDLRVGDNVLNVLLGHGFYDVRSKSVWDNDMAHWRDFPRMIAQLEIEYTDGTRETVVSDGSWKQVKSPVGWDDLREGEVIGGGHVREMAFPPGGFPVAEVPGPGGRLVAQGHPAAKILYVNRPTRIKALAEKGSYMVEFPENIAGWCRIRLRGLGKGDVVSVRYDEHVDGDLEPAVPNLRYSPTGQAVREKTKGPTPRRLDSCFKTTISGNVCPVDRGFQTDRFVSSGAGAETYEPRFTYNGFKYVLVKGIKDRLTEDDIEQCVISTDFPTIARFESSSPVLNRLMDAADRTYRANFTTGIPTDCPQREKNGWTGDASIASVYAQFQFENTAAYEKWIRDIVDSQREDGNIPCIVPSPRWGFLSGGGPVWDSALSVVPWNLYLYRDDRLAVEIAYPALVRYLSYAETKADAAGLVSYGLGDWIPPDWKRIPPVEFTSSCFLMDAYRLAANMARVLGKSEADGFMRKAADMRRAIRKKYHMGDGVFSNGGQTAQSLALEFGLCEPGERRAAEKKLVASVHARGDHLETGLIGCRTLFRALSNAGRTDLALRVLLRDTPPSPASWVAKGGKGNFWEDWGEGASRNHIMFGDIPAWVYEYVVGLRLAPDARAFRKFIVDPAWDCGLKKVSASVDTPYGIVSVVWRADGSLEVTVPPGCSATATLRDGSKRGFGPGRHRVGPDVLSRVDPFIGTAGRGNVVPGPTTPFALAQPGPDSRVADPPRYHNGFCCGYKNDHDSFMGFAQTHLSGTGCPDLSDFLLLPFTGEEPVRGFKDFATETSRPGYYSVFFTNTQVRTEITASRRGGAYRITWSGKGERRIMLDFQHGNVASYSGRRLEDHIDSSESALDAAAREVTVANLSQAWLKNRHVAGIFRFSKPWKSVRELPARPGNRAKRYVFAFDAEPGEPIEVRMAVSGVDVAGARANLDAEAGAGVSFDEIRRRTESEWRALLSRVRAEGTDDQLKILYTALYRAFQQPNVFTDVDFRFRDAAGKVRTAECELYTGFSLWDTFRAAHPLYTLLTPERVDGFVNSFLDQYRSLGFLPVIQYFGRETCCMNGVHSIPVIADAYAKGFRGFDADLALEAVTNTLTVTHANFCPRPGYDPPEDWDVLERYGWYPQDKVYSQGASRTLEIAYDEGCAASLAREMGNTAVAERFAARSMRWTNVFDRASLLVRGRLSDGSWREGVDPFQIPNCCDKGCDYTEVSAWGATWFVMHRPEELVKAFGGKERFAARLEDFFRGVRQYRHENEPAHHAAFLFPYADRPDITAELVREIVRTHYSTDVRGVCGNDDCGQMSAWYVFACMGFYPMDGFSGKYVIGAPQLPRMELDLGGGKTLRIVAKGLSEENLYVKSVSLNGVPVKEIWLRHADLVRGGELVYEMTSSAAECRARTVK